jgi:glycosyltransferase involved in cell wall biosynthesis
MIIALDARPLIQPQFQGPEQRARNILTAWVHSAAQHQFHLLYALPRDDRPFDDSMLKALPGNFHPIRLSSYQMPPVFHSGAWLVNPLVRTINQIKPDVYFAFTPEVPRVRICPVVPTFHDLALELDPVVRRAPVSRAQRRIAYRSLRYARRVHAVSSQTKFDIASVYAYPPAHIDVIYNGIDPAFSPVPPATIPAPRAVHHANNISGPYVLTIGADIPRRNYPRMLTAMQQVWKSPAGARIKWVLAGRTHWEISDIFTAARRAGALDAMRFVAAPTNAELADLYRCATLTVCASSFEGFGLSVLEAMACGTTVACSDMRSLREVAGDAAVYFPHDDAQAMGQAIIGLLEDVEYRRQLKYRGMQRAGLFTWETAAQLTLESLDKACRKPTSFSPPTATAHPKPAAPPTT